MAARATVGNCIMRYIYYPQWNSVLLKLESANIGYLELINNIRKERMITSMSPLTGLKYHLLL